MSDQRSQQINPSTRVSLDLTPIHASHERYVRSGLLDDLETAIRHLQYAVQLIPDEHADFPAMLNILGGFFVLRFVHTGDMKDISETIRHMQRAVQLAPDGHAHLPTFLDVLGNTLLLRNGDMRDISEAIRHQQRAVQLTPDGHADLPSRLNNLGSSYLRRFKCTGDMQDISEAIRHHQRAIRLIPDGHADLPSWLDNLGTSLVLRFERNGDMRDISEAIRHHQRAVKLTPDGHVSLPSRLNNLGDSFSIRFERSGDMQDISEAIHHQQRAVKLTPEGHAGLPAHLNNLGISILARFQRTGAVQDISEAIRHHQRAVKLTPDGHADLPSRLNNLGNSYLRRFEHSGDMQDVSKAIRHYQRAVQLTPDGHADLPSWLGNLGTSFMRRFERNGDMQDMSEAIRHHQHAAQLTPDGRTLGNLGTSFSCRFEHNGDMQDISEAIRHQQLAVQLAPDGHADLLPSLFGNLGTSFVRRFERNGNIQDISEAIRHLQRAVQSTPDGHADLPSLLGNLGISFSNRFKHNGDMQDISEAIRHHQRAVQLTPDGHADLPALLDNLGSSFSIRFARNGDMQDISEAIRHQQRAVQLIPDGHASLPTYLNNLGTSLSKRNGDMQDIAEAIRHLRRAIQLTPDGHANLPSYLNNLGTSFFKRSGELQDTSEAILHLQRAVRFSPEGHGRLPTYLNNLGNSFLSHFERTGTYESRQSAVLNFRLSATSSSGPPSVRLTAAKLWAALSQPSEVLEAYSCIIQLLSLISGLENTVQRRHETLVDTSQLSLAASAAALSLGHPDKALEWLLEGRCIVWNQINQFRTPVDDLRSYDPVLAERFSVLSRELENAGLRTDLRRKQTELSMHDGISLEAEARMHLKHAKDWEELLNTIRNIPQFKDFLRPRKCADIMRGLPEEGPIVFINIHIDRCDALALVAGADDPLHIPLPNFSHQEAERLVNDLRSYLSSFGVRSRLGRPLDETHSDINVNFQAVLQALWSGVVNPILGALAFSVPDSDARLPRIWWCPTGPLTFLPIHAAGIYEQGKGIRGQYLSEFAVSSYIPTINASNSVNDPPAGLLMVSQPNTPGMGRIPFARDEVEKIKKELGLRKIPSCTLDDENATVSHVLESMKKFGCIHLACHASQHAEIPLKSSIHLHNGPLELSAIMKKNLGNFDFAFLSACQTSKGDAKLPEEVVHLASGMLGAGYRSVVGTMWSVFDEHGPDLAEFFYKRLLEDDGGPRIDGRRAARALHDATKRLREKVSDSPYSFLAWVPYIHIGDLPQNT